MAQTVYHRRDKFPPGKPIYPPVIEDRWKGPGGYWHRIRLPRLARPVRIRTLFIEVAFQDPTPFMALQDLGDYQYKIFDDPDMVSALQHEPQTFKLEEEGEEATNEAAVGYYNILCPLCSSIRMWVVDWNRRGRSRESDVLEFDVPCTLAPDMPGAVVILKTEEIWR